MSQTKWKKKSAVAVVFSLLFLLSTISYGNAISFSYYAKAVMYFYSRCSMITNESQCTTSSCYWWDSSCHSYNQIPYDTGKYCVELDKNVQYCIANTQNYFIIEGVQTPTEKYCMRLDNDVQYCMLNTQTFFIIGGMVINAP